MARRPAAHALTLELFAVTNKIVRRAEKSNVRAQFDTFAEHPQIGDRLTAPDNQVVFGRRGSGKTHVFGWAAVKLQQQKKFALVVDYPAPAMIVSSKPKASDDPFTPASLYSVIRPFIVDVATDARTLATDSRTNVRVRNRPALDSAINALLSCADTIQFEYESTRVDTFSRHNRHSVDAGLGAELASDLIPNARVQAGGSVSAGSQGQSLTTREGAEVKVLDTARIARAVSDIVAAIDGQFYLFVDEWTRIPPEYQPTVAEFLKLTFCAVPNCIVKIGAVQERSRFTDHLGDGRRIGIELSSDAFADVNLDAWHPARAFEPVRSFLMALLFKHYRAVYKEHFGRTFPLKMPEDLVGSLFANDETFSEFVEACAGIPRDALNIIMKTTAYSGDKPITKLALRRGVLEWFRTDKQDAYKPGKVETFFFDWLKERVVFERRSKGFLVEDGVKDALIDDLRENRIIHLVNSSVSSKSLPGRRFRYYRLDYGCYADLLDTKSRPVHDLGESIKLDEFGGLLLEEIESDEREARDRARSVIVRMPEFYTHLEEIQKERQQQLDIEDAVVAQG